MILLILPLCLIANDPHVEKVLQECIDNEKTLGLSAIIIENGKMTFYAMGKPHAHAALQVTEDTIFDVGSISKVFTTSLMQILIDQKLFCWKDPLQKHLPTNVKSPEFEGRTIYLEDLAVHTAALPYMPDNCKMTDMQNPAKDYSSALLYEYLNTAKLKYMPGTKYDYSNLGIGLLGHIMELKCKKPYEELIKEHISQKLGMKDTCIVMDLEQKQRFARGHIGKDEVPNWDLPSIEGAGALRSTIRDLSKFLSAHMGLVDQPIVKSFAKTHKVIRAESEHGSQMAAGWHVNPTEKGTIIWHNGQTGGYHAYMGFIPEKKKGVVLLTNSGANFDSVGKHLLDSSFPIDEDEEDIVLDPLILDRYVGTYRHFTGLTCYLWREGDQLMGKLSGHPAVVLYPESQTRFFLKVMDVQVQFVLDSDDNIKGMNVFRGDQTFWIRKVTSWW